MNDTLWKIPILTLVFIIVVSWGSLITALVVKPTQPVYQPSHQDTYHPVHWVDAGNTDAL